MGRFRKILIANRGEIAVRVLRACRDRGISSVAVFSEADRAALHVRLADEAYPIGPAPSRESYLRIDRIVDVALASGADAIHPGYGFLAENPELARRCRERGLVFIGPRPETITLMGEKTSARREARAAGIPVVPGSLEPITDPAALAAEAESIGYPVMLKAAAGGGGKGLRLVSTSQELEASVPLARSEARNAFGDDRVYLEKAIRRPRHVEIQVFADRFGSAIHLGERECSLQRRHQKVVEESPSPLLTPALREEMGAMARTLAQRVGYLGAGTLEFLIGDDGLPYFLEMNTRLQVEHPVTELVTGLDLVMLQIRLAEGERLPLRQQDVRWRGHAIECRIYAEDPEADFRPSPGRITALRAASGPGVRDDAGVYEGFTVPIDYDPLLSKLVVWGEDRGAALARLRRALSEYRVLGVRTTIPFHQRAVSHPDFEAGTYDTSLAERVIAEGVAPGTERIDLAAAVAAVRAFRDRRSAAAVVAGPPAPSPWYLAGLREAQGRISRP